MSNGFRQSLLRLRSKSMIRCSSSLVMETDILKESTRMGINSKPPKHFTNLALTQEPFLLCFKFPLDSALR